MLASFKVQVAHSSCLTADGGPRGLSNSKGMCFQKYANLEDFVECKSNKMRSLFFIVALLVPLSSATPETDLTAMVSQGKWKGAQGTQGFRKQFGMFFEAYTE